MERSVMRGRSSNSHLRSRISLPLHPGYDTAILRHRLDHTPDLLEYLSNLRLADDEWRRERERVADGAEHQVLALEGAHHRVVAAPSDRVGARRNVDARGDS